MWMHLSHLSSCIAATVRHRIVPGPAPGMATQQPARGQDASIKKSMGTKRFNRVAGAGRRETARSTCAEKESLDR